MGLIQQMQFLHRLALQETVVGLNDGGVEVDLKNNDAQGRVKIEG